MLGALHHLQACFVGDVFGASDIVFDGAGVVHPTLVGADVGGAGEGGDAGAGEGVGEAEALFAIEGAVVDAPDEVAVEVNHAVVPCRRPSTSSLGASGLEAVPVGGGP